jgi:hypothetical protein
VEQLGYCRVQAEGDLDDRVEPNVELASLDRTVVAAIEASVGSEGLLGVATLPSSGADGVAEAWLAADFLEGIAAVAAATSRRR